MEKNNNFLFAISGRVFAFHREQSEGGSSGAMEPFRKVHERTYNNIRCIYMYKLS